MSTFIMGNEAAARSTVPASSPLRYPRRTKVTLVTLPEAAQQVIASFLTIWSGHALAATCKSKHQCPGFSPPCLRLASARQNNNLDRKRTAAQLVGPTQSSLVSLLQRGGGVRGEVILQNPSLLLPLCAALTAGHGRDITSLVINAYSFGEFVHSEAEEQQALGRVLEANLLPRLRKLMLAHTLGAADRQPVWRALGNGACPLLDTLRLPLRANAQLVAVADALERRANGGGVGIAAATQGQASTGLPDVNKANVTAGPTGSGSIPADAKPPATTAAMGVGKIRTLEVSPDSNNEESAIDHCVMDRLLRCSVFDSLCSLRTTRSAPSVASFLTATGAPSLTRLHMASHQGSGDDDLLLALSAGAAPQLEHLVLEAYPTSPAAIDTLCESIVQQRRVFANLITLELAAFGMIQDGPRYLEQLFTAIGTSHGCPKLESLVIRNIERPGTALKRALELGGLPRLKKLTLTGASDPRLADLCQALQLPGQVMQLSTLHVGDCSLGEDNGLGELQALSACLASSGCLRRLRVLDLHRLKGVDASAALPLAEVLGRGAGAHLESLTIPTAREGPHVGVEAVLSALADGACPRLRRLSLSRREEEGLSMGSVTNTDAFLREQERLRATRLSATGGQEDVYTVFMRVDSLVRLLGGGAACSRRLEEVCIRLCHVWSGDMDAVTAALCEPHAARLTALELGVGGGDVSGVMTMVSALATWPSGSRLVRLHVALADSEEEEEAELVQEHVAQAIEDGAWPQMEGEDCVRVWREEDLWGVDQGWQRTRTLLQTRRRVGVGV